MSVFLLSISGAGERIAKRLRDQATGRGSPSFRVIIEEMNDSGLQPFGFNIEGRACLPAKYQSPSARLCSLHRIHNTENVSKTQSVTGRRSTGALGKQPITGDVSGRCNVLSKTRACAQRAD